MSSASVPVLGPIPKEPFDFKAWQVPKPDTDDTDLLEFHLDIEGSGVPQQMCGLCAIGMYIGWTDKDGQWHEVLRYEVAMETLLDHPDQMARFWNTPNHQSAWDRIEVAKRPSNEVAEEIALIVSTLRKVGWEPHLFARPVGYDFREFSNFFTTQGLATFKREVIEGGNLEYYHKTAIMAVYKNILIGKPCPFGFGGAMNVTDINQQMRGWCQMLGITPVDFKIPMANVLGRSCLAHGGLQDAIDQAQTYHTILTAVKDYVGAMDLVMNTVSMDHLAKMRSRSLTPDEHLLAEHVIGNFTNARKNLVAYFTLAN